MRGHTETHREKHATWRQRHMTGREEAQKPRKSKDCQEPGGSMDVFFPGAFRGSPALPTPHYRFHPVREYVFIVLKALSLWHFVMAILGY